MRFIFESLDFLNPIGKELLLESNLMTSPSEINEKQKETEVFFETISKKDNDSLKKELDDNLNKVKDIRQTLGRLKEGKVLDEIELFEIKQLSLISERLKRLITGELQSIICLPDLSEVCEILDPEGSGLPVFQLYGLYDTRLNDLRRKINSVSPDSEESAALYAELKKIESEVKEKLSKKLRPFSQAISNALTLLGKTDLLYAKVRLKKKFNLRSAGVRNEGTTVWEGLTNPYIANSDKKKDRRPFQPVDIEIHPGVCLVTGANMGGKTVLLKTLALAQAMVQFGLLAPAAYCEVVPVEKIMTSIGDSQSELTGLSSFAAEMLTIDKIVNTLDEYPESLVLIDEPARTTNPEEGKAITAALINLLSVRPARTVITSHYSGLKANRRLRVKGLSESLPSESLTPGMIPLLMDYSLMEDYSEDVPHEALKIASMLGINPIILATAKEMLKNDFELEG